ncbi:ankyrin repeat and SOCS box protein 11 [Eucyclogobius newberryi]|uniref:ankyrin repeat and SOCS box protein 11 n=1 Tax=Eucyclogobius newberryi TaxID=166745 RepID=UPI003B5C42E8
MAVVQTVQSLFSQPWPPHIYSGMACNALMADTWADRTPLHEAACQGRLLHLRDLIAQGFHVDTLTMDRVSPLHEACLSGHYACAKFLLDNGANVNVISTDGATPLFNACSGGNPACVRLILQCEAFMHHTYQPASPIHEAAKQGHKECLELLLSFGAHIDLELPVLGTPLYFACLNRATASVRTLLLLGADVRLGCGQDSPLHAAVRGGEADIVDLLLDYGADGSLRNADGKTPLDIAEANSSVRRKLLTKGPCSLSQLCRLSVRRSLGRSRLHAASSLFLPHSIKAFLLYH